MQVLSMVEIFQGAPKETHVKVVKRIFRYLKNTIDYSLWYPRGDDFNLVAYIDVDWEGSVDDRESTSDGAFFLGDSLVRWLGKE